MTVRWTAVVPVKPWCSGKTRLELPAAEKVAFVRAACLDTLDTLAQCDMVGRVVLVSAEPELASGELPGATVLLSGPVERVMGGLNVAIELGREWALGHAPSEPIVVVPADLPALDSQSLGDALVQLAWFDRSHIPDARGKGTTLLAALRPDLLVPRYGIDSERAHAAEGSVPALDVELGTRLDVDTVEDLDRATLLGLACRTRSVAVRTSSET